ncbi:MAG: glycosyltransferase family 4 protein [Actinomycetes bacterium]
MRVLHVLTSPNPRGAESGAVALDRALRQRGVVGDIVCLTPPSGTTALNVEALGGHSLAPTTLMRLRARARFHDVVVAHGSRTLPASAISLVGTGVPFVYKNIGDTAYWSSTTLRRLRVGAALRRTAAVVTLHGGAKAGMHDHHGLSDSRVVVIPSWRSGERFKPVTAVRRRQARFELGLDQTRSVFLVMGALAIEKRFELAIEAVAPLPDAVLVIVGDGPERSRLERKAAAMMPGRCLFTGSVACPESVLPAADVVLLTSESEGVPGVLIEAGLSSLPVVAFDVGGVSSVVVDGATGLLVPPADVVAMTAACARVLGDARGMGRRARERCLHEYDTERVVDMWLALLRNVTDSAHNVSERPNF